VVFSSSLFLLFFFPVFLAVYFFIPKSLKNTWILIASLAFYYWGAPLFIYILVSATIIDFFLIDQIHISQNPFRKRLFLVFSLALNLGLLAYFKYANFFIENFNFVLQSAGFSSLSWTKIALPIGISFYTFETLTYAIDVYRGVHAPLKRIHHYLLYIVCFPKLIAGPIVRYNLIADQIPNRNETIDDRLFGFYRFCIGLAKKVLIANVLGNFAKDILVTPSENLSFEIAWLGILSYTFQIYFDFSGYSDMALGIGKMIGFKFPENFDNPYTSKSITEFWRRWHITLGDWMKNYLYIPLGGNKVNSNARLYVNLITVFLISGLWHGASWNFVIWGAYHGCFLILDRIFLKKLLEKLGDFVSVAFTFLFVLIGWIFFSIEEFPNAIAYIKLLFSFNLSIEPILLTYEFKTVMILAFAFSFFGVFNFGKRIQNFFYKEENGLLKTTFNVAISLLLFTVCVSYITASDFNPFIYFRF